MNVERLDKSELLRLTRLTVAEEALPASLNALGNQTLLTRRKPALLCSRSCPGEIILRGYDPARRLRDSGLTFIGGFHTPVERDFPHHLLGGRCKLIICPARGLEGMRLPAAWRAALEAGRCSHAVGQTTADARAGRRNDLSAVDDHTATGAGM